MSKVTMIPSHNRPLPYGAHLYEHHQPYQSFNDEDYLFYLGSQQRKVLCIAPRSDRVMRLTELAAYHYQPLIKLDLEGIGRSWSFMNRNGIIGFVLVDSQQRNQVIQPWFIYFRPGYCQPQSRYFFLMQQLLTLLRMWSGVVIGRPKQHCANHSKLYQMMNIIKPASRGAQNVAIPPSYVIKGYSQLKRLTHRNYVVKSLSNMRTDVLPAEYYERRCYQGINHVPVLFQQPISGTDIRAHVIKDSVFGIAIHKPQRLNYRYHARGDRLNPCTLDPSVQHFIKRVLKLEQRWLMGIDFLLTEQGCLYCLEANPSPGWSAFHEQDCPSQNNFLRALLNALQLI